MVKMRWCSIPKRTSDVGSSRILPNGPLIRWLCMRRECFPLPPTSKETASWRSRHASRHVRHARAVMHVGIANPRKTFPAFPAHAQPAILRISQEANEEEWWGKIGMGSDKFFGLMSAMLSFGWWLKKCHVKRRGNWPLAFGWSWHPMRDTIWVSLVLDDFTPLNFFTHFE